MAKDILLALGVYLGRTSGKPNVTMAVQKLNEDEAQLNRIELSPGQPRKTMIVSESGLYKLILRSDKPEAKAFQDWVTRDVLPAIRKDGALYRPRVHRSVLQKTPPALPACPPKTAERALGRTTP